jgi:alpha-beta hydrolase superfamily lysophospholipase
MPNPLFFEAVNFTTSDKLTLPGLLHLPEKPAGVCIFIHGLTGDVFGKLGLTLTEHLSQQGYGTLLFNNRGAGIVSKFKKIDKRKAKGYESQTIGTAFEDFRESAIDIQAAVDYLKKQKIKNICLVGHSTGCQKSIYYLAQRGKQKQIQAVVLLAPVSDYAAFKRDLGDKLQLPVLYAKKLIADGKGGSLLPKDIFSEMVSAQRLVSLATVESEEEIFTYASDKNPVTLQKVTTPIMAIFGELDEYNDRPVLALVEWFEENLAAKKKRVEWIEGATHSFTDKEERVARLITSWLTALTAKKQ